MAKAKAGEVVRYENPLMPDERLRQMYTAMVQMRMLEERLRRRAGSGKPVKQTDTIRGEEAARASTALSLGAGDLISDHSTASAMDLLLGVKLEKLLLRNKKNVAAKLDNAEEGDGHAVRLARAEDVAEQMEITIGAAAALKAQRGGRVLLVYVAAGEVKKKTWRRTLGAAGRMELPVLYMVLPRPRRKREDDASGEVSVRSRMWGVPGFPVDGSDAIALYRVMQESLLRARSGGGPALMECVSFPLGGKAARAAEDPVERLKGLLLTKGAADADWVKQTRAVFLRRLGGTQR